jgi:hypothetical protein
METDRASVGFLGWSIDSPVNQKYVEVDIHHARSHHNIAPCNPAPQHGLFLQLDQRLVYSMLHRIPVVPITENWGCADEKVAQRGRNLRISVGCGAAIAAAKRAEEHRLLVLHYRTCTWTIPGAASTQQVPRNISSLVSHQLWPCQIMSMKSSLQKLRFDYFA